VFLSKPTTDPLVSVLVSCLGDAATIHDTLQWEWTPGEVKTGGKDGIGGMSD